jgi:hypothetical protein
MNPGGGEMRYERDLPACCRQSADGNLYECPLCNAMWQRVEPVEPEAGEPDLMQNRERKGAA